MPLACLLTALIITSVGYHSIQSTTRPLSLMRGPAGGQNAPSLRSSLPPSGGASTFIKSDLKREDIYITLYYIDLVFPTGTSVHKNCLKIEISCLNKSFIALRTYW